MVWGMMMPAGFGDFWPNGAAEYDKNTRESGWRERLRLHYLAQPPEEQRRLLDYGENHVGYGAGGYASYVASKFFSELGVDTFKFGSPEHPCSKPYTAVEPHEVPHSYTTEKTHNLLGSFIQLSGLGIAVDETLKAILERLEPGVHQFFPIEIRMPKGKTYPTQYYIMVIGQYIDSFSPGDSDPYSWHDYKDKDPTFYYYHYSKDKDGITGLALSKKIFGKAHLWRERRFNGILICLSNELKVEIATAGLRIPKHYKMMEV